MDLLRLKIKLHVDHAGPLEQLQSWRICISNNLESKNHFPNKSLLIAQEATVMVVVKVDGHNPH